jgi:4-hydroxy-tetrahydrodipicolinate synthase
MRHPSPAVIAMSITPFGRDGSVDEPLLRDHLRFLAEGGVGVCLCSQGSGEGDLLTLDEKARIYEIGVDELHGRVPVFAAGLGLAHATAEVVRLAQTACATGVDGVYVLGPSPGAFRLSDTEVEAYYRAIADAVTCPILIGSNALLGRSAVNCGLLIRLVTDYQHITEIVLSEAVESLLTSTARLADAVGDRVRIRTGIASQAVSTWSVGASGMLCYEANIAPRLAAGLWQALAAWDGSAVLERNLAFLRLHLLCSRFGNPRVIKAALRLTGHQGGDLRPPYASLDAAQMLELMDGLRTLGFDVSHGEGLRPFPSPGGA